MKTLQNDTANTVPIVQAFAIALGECCYAVLYDVITACAMQGMDTG
jgi:hypothetical protein